MKTRTPVVMAAIMTLLLSGMVYAGEASKIDEQFLNLNRWKRIDGNKPKIVKRGDETCLALNNSVIMTTLPKPANVVIIKAKIQNITFKRGQWICVFNKNNTKGIGIIWDSSRQDLFHGEGFVSILHFDLDKPVTLLSPAKKLIEPIQSGVKVGSDKFLKIAFKLDSKFIHVSFNDHKVKVDNPMKEPFENLVMRGLTTGFFDKLIIQTH